MINNCQEMVMIVARGKHIIDKKWKTKKKKKKE